jgi:transposase
MSAMELKQLVKAYIINNVKIEVEHLAEAGGHTSILFTPAYHSDLQLIKLVWALAKEMLVRNSAFLRKWIKIPYCESRQDYSDV